MSCVDTERSKPLRPLKFNYAKLSIVLSFKQTITKLEPSNYMYMMMETSIVFLYPHNLTTVHER